MSFLKASSTALATGLLFAGAFPPFDQWWLAWLWLLPLLLVLWSDTPRRGWRQFFFGLRYGWLAGLAVFTGTLWWVGHVSIPGMLALCVYLAVYMAVWAAFAALLRPRSPGQGLLVALTLALLWTGLEWIRGNVPVLGFPWNGAAVPLVAMPGLRSLAAQAGVTGLSVLPLFFMTGLAAAWTLRKHPGVRGRALLMAASMATPAVVTLVTWEKSPQPAGHVQVMLVQPNVPMEIKMNLNARGLPPERREELTEQNQTQRYEELLVLTFEGYRNAKTKPELIVWPESAIPGYFHDRMHDAPLDAVLKLGPVALMTGADALTADDAGADSWDGRNCAALLHGTRENFLLHAKVQLVPFGEYIPLRRQIPILETMVGHLIPADFTAGTSVEPMRMESISCDLIPLVCFEDTIGKLARRFVREAPQVLVNITNDNWFHESNESAIHALNARWRCLELDRPMVRSANTGVTCVIDTEGRITDQLPRWKQGVLHASVPLTSGGITFYAAHGDVIAIGAGIAGLLLAAILLTRRQQ